jgi:glycosyltransferase involved in cell wall biosynthesis
MTPVVLVAGDLTTWGGMDRANYELARYLADRGGRSVHVVSHTVAEPLASHPNIIWHRVPKPFGSYTCAEPLLGARGRQVARELATRGARVVVNGGNCRWSDVNWVHAVHAAWPTRVEHASAPIRVRAALIKRRARRAERRLVGAARLVVTNSHQARAQLVERVGIHPDRVHVVYYGIQPEEFRPATPAEQDAARQACDAPLDRRMALFVGALGNDRNKGFDVAFNAWRELAREPRWDVDLVAVGAGNERELWEREIRAHGLEARIRLVGFRKDMRTLLRAADVLISPTHYDAYGLAVHEALCCGVPAVVTQTAGVAERYPPDLTELLIPWPPTARDLVERLRSWHANPDGFKRRALCFGQHLRERTWTDMAGDIAGLLASAA